MEQGSKLANWSTRVRLRWSYKAEEYKEEKLPHKGIIGRKNTVALRMVFVLKFNRNI